MIKTRYIMDGHGTYVTYRLTVGKVPCRGIRPACVSMCEQKLHRPHLTCLRCIPRKIYKKQLPHKMPVGMLTLPVFKEHPYFSLKGQIQKFLLTLVGWTLQ